ncbi:MAG TPA: sugar ABC transporter substrate-binding protein [Spirochaetia bacterium]|nr:sugar ABC transporter substrate-binding protein [Spirochaetia bacterium]
MKWLYRVLAILLFSAVATAFLFANGSQEKGKVQQATVKWDQWWYSDPVRGPNVTWEIQEFEKTHPNIKVVPAAISSTAYWDQIPLDIASGTEGDIVTLDTGAGMNQYYNQRPGGAFVDLKPYIKGYTLPDGTNLEKDIVLLDQMDRNGKTIALPFLWFAAPDTAYRKSDLKNAGIDPSQLTTWSGYENAAKALAKDGKYGFGQPDSQDVLSRWWLMNWLWTAGGGIFPDEKGPYTADRLIFNSQANIYALTYLKRLIDEAGPSGQKSYPELEALFANGNLATMQIALWGVGNLQKNMKPAGSFESDLGLAPFPSLTLDGVTHKPVYVAWGNPLALSTLSKNPKAAFEFMAFLDSKAVQERETVAAAPVNTLVMPWYKEHFPVQYTFLNDARKYTFRIVPDIANWNQWDHVIQESLNAALLGTKSVKDALDWGQQQMIQLLKQN